MLEKLLYDILLKLKTYHHEHPEDPDDILFKLENIEEEIKRFIWVIEHQKLSKIV